MYIYGVYRDYSWKRVRILRTRQTANVHVSALGVSDMHCWLVGH